MMVVRNIPTTDGGKIGNVFVPLGDRHTNSVHYLRNARCVKRVRLKVKFAAIIPALSKRIAA